MLSTTNMAARRRYVRRNAFPNGKAIWMARAFRSPPPYGAEAETGEVKIRGDKRPSFPRNTEAPRGQTALVKFILRSALAYYKLQTEGLLTGRAPEYGDILRSDIVLRKAHPVSNLIMVGEIYDRYESESVNNGHFYPPMVVFIYLDSL